MKMIYIGFYRILTEFLGLIIKIILLVFSPRIYSQRFKFRLKSSGYYWVHVASVGEFNAIKPLIISLINLDKKILLTTMTATGYKEAIKSGLNMEITLFPIDTPHNMRNFFNLVQPEMIIIEETEFWPNMLLEAKKRKIKIIFVNGRISDRSFSRYKVTKKFWQIFDHPNLKICTQSDLDTLRFKEIGFRNISKCNNMKFSINIKDFNEKKLRQKYGFSESDKIIVFGSSRPGEEKLILNIFERIKTPALKLVIVPRHLNRLGSIKKLLPKNNFNLLTDKTTDQPILLVDKMGVLIEFYAISDISIVGGSFFDFGGHNPLEPAAYSKPIIIGEYHHSCRDSVNKLLEKNAVIISNINKLEQDILALLNSKEERIRLGRNAFQVIKENSNSLDLHLKEILDFENR